MFASSLVLVCGLTAARGRGRCWLTDWPRERTAGEAKDGRPRRAARGGLNAQGRLLTSLQWPRDRLILHLPPDAEV